jgi:hypothetical protein
MEDSTSLNLVSLAGDAVVFTVGFGTDEEIRKMDNKQRFIRKNIKYQVVGDLIEEIDGSSQSVSQPRQNAGSTNSVIGTRLPFKQLQSEFSINQRFDFLNKFTNMVLDGIVASTIVTGEGGLGKSHTVLEAVKARGWKEGREYVVIKGFATPKALYGTLFDHNGKVIIFDDCDSVLKDPVSLNILKSALDSYDVRTISWLSKGFVEDEYPSSFEFTGQVIFISNINSSKMDGAILSRAITVDLSMTLQDKIERMQHILPTILPEFDMAIKETALDFMAKHSDEAREFNLRTLQKSIKVIAAYGIDDVEWEAAVKYLLVHV